METFGGLMILAGFAIGIFAMVADLGSPQISSAVSIGLVVVGLVLAIVGKKRG